MVASVLIATAFLGTTLHDRIASTQDQNKDSYLKAIADRIVTNCGESSDWGANDAVPSNLGLAAASQTCAYALDPDKISRLNSQNAASLSMLELVNSTKLTDIAFGIQVSQLLSIDIEQISNSSVSSQTSFNFQVSTTIDSKPAQADLHCYVIADNYFVEFNASTGLSGTGEFSTEISTSKIDHAMLVAFGRVPFDERITSYATYVFSSSAIETIPSSTQLELSPLDGTLSFNGSAGVSVSKVYALTYSYQQGITSIQDSSLSIPHFLDASPFVLVACGTGDAGYLQEWTSYPQVPLTAGSFFQHSERNVFTYTVTIDGVLYKLQLSLGAINP